MQWFQFYGSTVNHFIFACSLFRDFVIRDFFFGDLNSWCIIFSYVNSIWAASSEFLSSSIPSWQISTVHAQPFRGARDLVFCLKVPLDSLLVWASSEGSGETARMRRLAWTFAARIGDKYQIRLTRSIYENISRECWISECWISKNKVIANNSKLTVYRRIYCRKFLTLSNQTSSYIHKCIRISVFGFEG